LKDEKDAKLISTTNYQTKQRELVKIMKRAYRKAIVGKNDKERLKNRKLQLNYVYYNYKGKMKKLGHIKYNEGRCIYKYEHKYLYNY